VQAIWMFREQDLANVALTVSEREAYLSIWAKQPYFAILQLVLGITDRGRLQGCMCGLRKPGSEVSYPPLLTLTRHADHVHHQNVIRETLPSLEPVQNALTKTYKRRFPELEDSEIGRKNVTRLESAVLKGLDYLIPLLEFAKLQSIYLDLHQQRTAATASGKGAASVMSVRSPWCLLAIHNC
jgi:hypothetical protein